MTSSTTEIRLSDLERGMAIAPDAANTSKSWSGRIVKGVLYSATGASGIIGTFELINGALIASELIGGFGSGGIHFTASAIAYAVGVSTLILGCCSNRFIAEKKLEGNVSDLTDAADDVGEVHAKLKDEIAKLNRIIEEFKAKVDESQTGTQTLKALLGTETDKFEDFATKIAANADLVANMKGQIADQKKNIKQIEDANKELKKNIKDLEQANKQLSGELDEAHEAVKKFDGENEELKAENLSLKKNKDDLAEIVAQLKSNLEAVRLRNEADQKENEELLKKVRSLDEVDDKIKLASENLREIEQKKTKLAADMNEILASLKDLEEYKETLQPLLDALAAMKDK